MRPPLTLADWMELGLFVVALVVLFLVATEVIGC